jgi:hypothetical protein
MDLGRRFLYFLDYILHIYSRALRFDARVAGYVALFTLVAAVLPGATGVQLVHFWEIRDRLLLAGTGLFHDRLFSSRRRLR